MLDSTDLPSERKSAGVRFAQQHAEGIPWTVAMPTREAPSSQAQLPPPHAHPHSAQPETLTSPAQQGDASTQRPLREWVEQPRPSARAPMPHSFLSHPDPPPQRESAAKGVGVESLSLSVFKQVPAAVALSCQCLSVLVSAVFAISAGRACLALRIPRRCRLSLCDKKTSWCPMKTSSDTIVRQQNII